jgi:hypothetical protein
LLVVLAFPSSADAAGLDANPPSLGFAQDVGDGPSPPPTSVVTNNTGGLITFDFPRVTGPSGDFQLLTNDLVGDCSNRGGLFPGDSCNVRVRFDPSSTTPQSDTVTVNAGADSVAISLSGTGTFRQLDASPGAIPFGQQSIGAGPTASTPVTVTNSGTGPVALGTPTIVGTDANQFEVSSTDCTGTLDPTKSCTVNVDFDPSTLGDKSAELDVPSNAPTVKTTLTGTGIQAQLTRSPDTLTFTAEVNTASAPQTATVTNVGTESVPISSVVISDTLDFSQLTGGAGDCTPGTTVPVGGTCEVRIAFNPATKGPKSATVTVNSAAPPISIALNGTATFTALDLPGTLDFGSLEIGTGRTSIESAPVTNSGTQPIALGAIRLKDPDTARFMWARGLASDCAPGGSLAAGATCDLRVVFAPQSDGTKVGTMTVESSVGTKTLLITAAATPGLRIPAFSARSSATQNRRLNVTVAPLGGTVSNIVVLIKTRSGSVIGRGTLTRTAAERTVSVHLKSRLRPGRYVATASGRDLFADIVTAPARTFSVR